MDNTGGTTTTTTITQPPTHAITAPPPDGGYGWVIVSACFILNGFTWGITSSFGVYLSEYMSADRFHGSQPLEFGFVGGLNFSCAMLVAPLVTHLVRRFGIHAVMIPGCFLQSLGYGLASLSTRVWHLYLTQGALVGIGIGSLVVPSTAVLSQWFSRRRSVANGISSAGSGVGGAAFTWGTAAAIRNVGIDWTLRITGLVAFTATLIATLVLRDRNQHVRPTQAAFDVVLLCRTEVILLLCWTFASMFGYVTLLFSLSDFGLAIGLSESQATSIIGFLNVGTALGRPIIGIVSDRFSRIGTAASLTFACGVICFALWIPARSFALTLVFAILCGAILGVFWMTIGPLAVEIAGLKETQSLLSLAWATTVIPSACGEPIALVLRGLSSPRAYLYAQLFAGCSYMIAGVFIAGLWKVNRSKNHP
ncbi:MFS transporter, MCP family, solute carrier family 16, member 6 [Microdochium trichocladiopsis]|uniref:MFS transporter, MCP family, solute carrier family 16, member 6 n=1 Tax=Microdochium trichocladiopsis TaxID=1682393 RepID=A0A9P8Y0V9_9PEZI|nr:MFS transporter, MCP family, solute carrier family 16, member 6 [Microdochium trichocladiopsis]KAH7026734.1 MFS transporter, MCP family, solute carrier family 16, member 6 [Microdochium trichocladiopsis]